MTHILRYFLAALLVVFGMETALAQTYKIKEMHKVKRKETIFGIARDNGLTVEELIRANPDMNKPGYELKKGEFIAIPYPTATTPATTANAPTTQKPAASPATDDVRSREVRVGVMLPLHDENGDGRRMVEYYRGVLMACDSLRQTGVSVDVHAWNVPEGADIKRTLKDKAAEKLDLIIGPLYSSQVKELGEFAKKHNIKVLIPFSINAPEVKTCPNLYQVYQSPDELNEATIGRFLERFAGYHAVFIDCNDTTSRKGSFTFGLRRRMETMGRPHSITNLKSSETQFAKAFSTTLPNVVVLNTGRSPELNVAFAKLNGFLANNPKLEITMFGYTEWMMYTKYDLDNFYKFNVHIPATFYVNPLSWRTSRAEQKFRWNFHADMQQALPRFALTGFDQAFFFIKGLKTKGAAFTGAKGSVGYTPIQTPLRFERVAQGGGYQNRSLLFVHYSPGRRVETINY